MKEIKPPTKEMRLDRYMERCWKDVELLYNKKNRSVNEEKYFNELKAFLSVFI